MEKHNVRGTMYLEETINQYINKIVKFITTQRRLRSTYMSIILENKERKNI